MEQENGRLNMKLSEFLKKARKDAGYKVVMAADLSGIARSSIRDWEHDRKTPSLYLLNDYLDFLGVSLTIGKGGDLKE